MAAPLTRSLTMPRFKSKLARWSFWLGALLIAFLAFAVFATRTTPPALAPGVTKENRSINLAGRDVAFTLYWPVDRSHAPLVIVAHGFTRSERYMAGWGTALAAEGFIAAVPTQPALADHDLNAQVLATLADHLREHRRVGLMGFSMGGLTTLLASAKTPVDAWAGLDPVDMDGSGAKAASKLRMPCGVLLAEPESWNMHGNARRLLERLKAPRFALKVRGATHLDPESPTDLLGQLACGFADPARHAIFRRYAIAFLKSVLKDDLEAQKVLEGASDDSAVTGVENNMPRLTSSASLSPPEILLPLNAQL